MEEKRRENLTAEVFLPFGWSKVSAVLCFISSALVT